MNAGSRPLFRALPKPSLSTGTYSYCDTRFWADVTPLTGFGCARSAFQQDVYKTYSGESACGASQQVPTSSTASSAIQTAGGQASLTSGSQPPPSSPSPGAIAGIAVGGLVVLLLLAALVFEKSRSWIFRILHCTLGKATMAPDDRIESRQLRRHSLHDWGSSPAREAQSQRVRTSREPLGLPHSC